LNLIRNINTQTQQHLQNRVVRQLEKLKDTHHHHTLINLNNNKASLKCLESCVPEDKVSNMADVVWSQILTASLG